DGNLRTVLVLPEPVELKELNKRSTILTERTRRLSRRPFFMPDLPAGTITFLFTDIEGSTRLWEEQPDTMRLPLARHDTLLRAATETNGGTVFKTIGDAFCAAFPTAPEALEAALSAQQNLQSVKAGVGSDLMLKVRMALHTGAADQRDGDYFGQPL